VRRKGNEEYRPGGANGTAINVKRVLRVLRHLEAETQSLAVDAEVVEGVEAAGGPLSVAEQALVADVDWVLRRAEARTRLSARRRAGRIRVA